MPTINNIIYTLISINSTAIVSGYTDTLTSVTIPTTITDNNITYLVTSIADNAFKNNTYLFTISTGDNVTSIGNESFNGCTNLTSITFGTAIVTIGSQAFKDCALTSVTIPNTITSIGSAAFNKCTKMTSVSFTSTSKITLIDDDTFDGCSTINNVTIPSTVTSLGNNAFRSCLALTSLVIPNTVSSIGTSLFENCRTIVSVTIGNSITSIPNYMFKNCWALTTVNFGYAITSIGTEVFNTCSSLTTITIPNTITSIGSSTFISCSILTTVIIGNSVSSISDSMFKNCSKLLNITIGSSVLTINNDAFNSCSSLSSVTIPSSVTYIGSAAFNSCSSLSSLTIPSSIISIGETAFLKCSSLTSVTIPNSVISIGNGAFDSCSKITYVIIGSGVTTMGLGVFSNIGTTLTSVYFLCNYPSSSIDNSVFTNDANVSLYYVSGTTGWSSSVAGKTAYLAPTITSVSTSNISISADTSLSSTYIYTSVNNGLTWSSTQIALSNGTGSIFTSLSSGSYVSTIGNYFDIITYTSYNKLVPITCTITSSKTIVYAGQTSIITFSMSTATSKFSNSFISLIGGTLSTVTTSDSGSTYTATFTPTSSTNTIGYISVSGTSSDATTTFSSTSVTLSILTTITYVTITSNKTSLAKSSTATITFTMSLSTTSFTSSNLTISSGSIGSITRVSGTSYTATYTSPSSFSGATISVTSINTSYVSNTLSIPTSGTGTVKKSPYKGALVYYVDSDGNILPNSPTAVTDANGNFVIATDNLGSDFSVEPLKVTGGSNILTGQSITYWYAKAGTLTMTPITNLLFYCTTSGSLTDSSIIIGVGISDTLIQFSNYDDYAILINPTISKLSTTYKDALIANNLGNAINIFATIGSYFLYSINGTDLDSEYDAMMRSIANISTNRIDGNGIYHNDFADLFGTNLILCSEIIGDRLSNKITNNNLLNNTDSSTGKTYAILFASAMAYQMAGIITTVMASDNFSNTQIYESIGYNVNPYIYQLLSTLKLALSNSSNNKNDILEYFTNTVGSIFKNVASIHSNTIYNADSIPGFSNKQTLGNIRSSENAIMRRQVVKSWNTAYASGIVNGASRIVTPFRAITNSGDFLQRNNYICGGPNQVNADKPGLKNRIGSMLSECDYSGIQSSTCNVKYVPDSSDYIKYKKLRANNQNYNDIKGGGYKNSSYTNLMHVRRR